MDTFKPTGSESTGMPGKPKWTWRRRAHATALAALMLVVAVVLAFQAWLVVAVLNRLLSTPTTVQVPVTRNRCDSIDVGGSLPTPLIPGRKYKARAQ